MLHFIGCVISICAICLVVVVEEFDSDSEVRTTIRKAITMPNISLACVQNVIRLILLCEKSFFSGWCVCVC